MYRMGSSWCMQCAAPGVLDNKYKQTMKMGILESLVCMLLCHNLKKCICIY